MNKIRYTLAVVLLGLCLSLYAQKTAIYKDQNAHFKRGMGFYEQGLYGPAQKEFQKLLTEKPQAEEGRTAEILYQQADLHFALCAMRLGRPDSEKLILDFIQRYEPSTIASLAIFEIANYYYNAKEYDEAISYYQKIDDSSLGRKQALEVQFKQSYAYFVRKKFDRARAGFKELLNRKDEYYYPSNYYYGICCFFEGDYDDALGSFKRVNKSKKYGKVVPYYIIQIYFARGEYDELIEFAQPYAKAQNTKYHSQINQLIGQAYFEKEEFEKALPYLETYVEQAGQITQQGVYQLAYTQYKTGNYTAAIQNFEELRDIDSEFGQNALYNLADSYLKTDRKNTARSAFLAASKMPYDKEIQEASLFHYAKLSYELHQDRDAINTLMQIKAGSNYHTEAQNLLGNIFLNTRDYTKTLEIIESLPSRSPKIKEAYQKVAYYRGVQLYNDGNVPAASSLFKKSLDNAYDPKIKALSLYWLAEIDHINKKYDNSIDKLGQYQGIVKSSALPMPEEASIYTSSYSLGYNYLKKKEYATAAKHFQDGVDGIYQDFPNLSNAYLTGQLLPDATLRLADCYFKINNYPKASQYYETVINAQYAGFDYAMYQNSIILGLQNPSNPIDKILLLEKLYTNYPTSYYADEAIYSLGLTYLKIEKLPNAAEMFDLLLQKYQDSDQTNAALLKLGLIKVNLGENEQGLEYFKRVFTNNPDSQEAKDAMNGIEEIYISMDNVDGYFSFLESIPGYEVSDIKKDSILFKGGESHFADGDYERAAKGYSDYLRKFPKGPNSLQAYFKRGESYYVLKQYESALSDYETVINRGKSKYSEAAAKSGALVAYNVSKDFGKAYNLFRKYEEVASTEDNKYAAQLGALRSAYRIKHSDGVYDTGELVHDNKKASKSERAEAKFYIGKTAFAGEKLDKSRDAFNRVIKLTEDERAAEAMYMIAYIYYLERDLDVAQELCLSTNRQIVGYEYWQAKSVLLLADVFIEKGDTFNARASLESIVDNYTGDQEIVDSAKEKLAKLKAKTAASSRIKPEPDKNADLEMEEGDNN